MMMSKKARAFLIITLAVGTLAVSLIRLDTMPPLWFDEGWTLTVARTWVERGHYGVPRSGESATPGLSAAFPVTVPIALSFRLLGVGVWQGRLPGVLLTLGALVLLWVLGRTLYDASVATAAVSILVLLSPHQFLNPLLMGRQAMGEMPAVFYLLAGYVAFAMAHRSAWYVVPSALFWGAALDAKEQVLPFWLVSVIIPILWTTIEHHWNLAARLAVTLAGSVAAARLFSALFHIGVSGQAQPAQRLLMYDVTALVMAPGARIMALEALFGFEALCLVGICCAAVRFVTDQETVRSGSPEIAACRLSLILFSGSWVVWYALFSAGWVRYLFPAAFVGSIFGASLLSRWTSGFSFSATFRKAASLFRGPSVSNLAVVLLLVLVCDLFISNSREFYAKFVHDADDSAYRTAEYLNTQTPPDSLIETYEAELFFFLKRKYHYPPDSVHVELNRRLILGQNASVDYDPMAVDPDYLVIGPFARSVWDLYSGILKKGGFVRDRTIGRYTVYVRYREGEQKLIHK